MMALPSISLDAAPEPILAANDKTGNTVVRLLSFPEKYYCRITAHPVIFSRASILHWAKEDEWRRLLGGSDAASVYLYPSRFECTDAPSTTILSGAMRRPKP